MKKNYLKIFVALAFVFSLGACSNCVECGDCPTDVTLYDDNDNEVASREYCEEDFDSKEDYDQAISLIEGFGCDCK